MATPRAPSTTPSPRRRIARSATRSGRPSRDVPGAGWWRTAARPTVTRTTPGTRPGAASCSSPACCRARSGWRTTTGSRGFHRPVRRPPNARPLCSSTSARCGRRSDRCACRAGHSPYKCSGLPATPGLPAGWAEYFDAERAASPKQSADGDKTNARQIFDRCVSFCPAFSKSLESEHPRH